MRCSQARANFLLGDYEETPLDDIGAYLVTQWVNNADVNSPTFCLDMQCMLHSEMEQSAYLGLPPSCFRRAIATRV